MRTDADGIVWLLFDKKDSSANTLSAEVLAEFDAILKRLESNPPRGVVIRSGKPGGFIAGADITQFRGVKDAAQIEALITRGHAVLDRLDRLPHRNGRRHPRLLPWRRARTCACLRLSHRHR